MPCRSRHAGQGIEMIAPSAGTMTVSHTATIIAMLLTGHIATKRFMQQERRRAKPGSPPAAPAKPTGAANAD
jgi:hypothetical protein